MWSEAFATDGERQGGWADVDPGGGGIHAALWHGSADTFVDMNPSGGLESVIRGMALDEDGEGVQVGWARFSSGEFAAVWRGTPDSFVNLNPSGARGSRLYATTGTIHCGYVNITGNAEAGLWIGDDPGSFINLEPFLGPGWSRSNAEAISIDRGRIHVVGSALSPDGRPEAVLWIGRLRKVLGSVDRPRP